MKGVVGAIFRRGALGAAFLVMVVMAGAPAAPAKEIKSPWTWTNYGPALRDVSCSSPGKCVGVGQRGAVLHTAGAGGLAWSGVNLTSPENPFPDELAGVTCHAGAPSGTFCLAVSNDIDLGGDFHSKVYRSTDNGATWSGGVELPAAGVTQSAAALACDPAADACYAVGPSGGAWRSLDQGRKWEPLELPAMPGSYRRVACPSRGKCVAVGGRSTGAIIEGTKIRPLPPPVKMGRDMLGLACDKPTRCTATTGPEYLSVDLTAAEPKWGPAQLFFPPPSTKGTSVTALACPAEDHCVGVGKSGSGDVSVGTASLSEGAWDRLPLPTTTHQLTAISCERIGCVAVGQKALWFSNLDVVDVGATDWKRDSELSDFNAVHCSEQLSPLCVAGGDTVIGASHSRGTLWSWSLEKAKLNTQTIHCAAPSECLILGMSEVLFTKDLIHFIPRQPPTTDPAGTDVQTCITQVLCVGLGGGVTYTTLDGAQTGWVQTSFPGGKTMLMACVPGRTDPVTCVAAPSTGDFVYRGTMPKNDPKGWKWVTALDADVKIMALACSPGGQCVAVAPEGVILTSQGDLRKWTKHVLPDESTPKPDRPLLSSVVCPAVDFCLAGGQLKESGIIATTRDFWGDFTLDKIPPIGPAGAPMIKAFSCETTNHCVAVGNTVLVGRRKIGLRR